MKGSIKIINKLSSQPWYFWAGIIFSLTLFLYLSGIVSFDFGKSHETLTISPLSKTEVKSLKQYLISYHTAEAHKSKVAKPIANREALDDSPYSKYLKEVKSGKYYVIANLTHSAPFLCRNTANFIDELGMRFEQQQKKLGLCKYRFIITSLLRTVDDQKRLMRVNGNATPNETSHYFGVSVDISQFNFYEKSNKKPVYSAKLQILLAREILKMQNEGKCYVILENQQKCFHITARF